MAKTPPEEFSADSNAKAGPWFGTRDKGKKGSPSVGTKDNPQSPAWGPTFPWELFKNEQSLSKRLKEKFKSDEERRQEGLKKMSTRKSTEV